MRAIALTLSAIFLFFYSFTAQAAELVMVEEPGCAWCIKWERELGDIYPKTSEGKYAPLKKVELSAMRRSNPARNLGFAPARPVVFTPTFLLVENGEEVGRIQGYPGEDFFWGLLEQMLVQHTSYTAPAK